MVTQSGLLSKDALPQQAFDSAISVADTAGHHTVALLAAMAASLRPGSTVMLYEPMQVTGVPVPGINKDVCQSLCLHALRWCGEIATCLPINISFPAGDSPADSQDPLQAAAFGRLYRRSRVNQANQYDLCKPHRGELCASVVVTWQLAHAWEQRPPYNMPRCVGLHGAGSS